ncbi:DnaJ-like protein subfamily C member 13 [Elysia marginata]|uniref:DnaJ-like protein subfamily C member 13 n=1 Tax=Elysia marginata TaxID=1093978 RepID=A0AAV4EQN7_9GAST|nr:DnaJ-like protein subfamily C member 13 [Elysia marginata]
MMATLKDNKDVACYFITKHSWKGKYKRIFSVGTHGITTYNPGSFEITNQWAYNEFIGIAPNIKAANNQEFIITMKKGAKKTETMKFSTDHRADLLTEALVSDFPGGIAIIYGGFNRLHLFALEQRDELCKAIADAGTNYVGVLIRIRKEPITFDQFQANRLGKYRDSLIASVLDGVRASGNRDVCVKMYKTPRGYRLGPFTVPVDEEVEATHLKSLHAVPAGMTFNEAVSRFNANISYSGLLHAVTAEGLFAQNKEKLINLALQALIEREGDQERVSNECLEAQFHALRRLVASKAGYQGFTEIPKMREKVGLKVVKALKRKNDAITHSAIDMLCALMQPMHDNYDLRQEQLNKTSLMSSRKFLETLLEMFNENVEGDAEIAAKMQDLALSEGALPKHLHTAMFTQSTDSRMLTNRSGPKSTHFLCLTSPNPPFNPKSVTY